MPRLLRSGYAIAQNAGHVSRRSKSRLDRIMSEYGSVLALGALLLALGMAIRIGGTMVL